MIGTCRCQGAGCTGERWLAGIRTGGRGIDAGGAMQHGYLRIGLSRGLPLRRAISHRFRSANLHAHIINAGAAPDGERGQNQARPRPAEFIQFREGDALHRPDLANPPWWHSLNQNR
jgi:hypothetical protein